ncbi:MAG: helix-turn-helix domain-containing protein [Defluviitaleaceae bacterium]|nr:helix-turn-helix domain-containing protein [Defluviitaleaceae bacterium]
MTITIRFLELELKFTYKLLVVDDEIKIADGIANTVCWKSIGVTVAGCASDGLEALEMARLCQPDIIITDIKMDKMDGLTMVNEVSQLYPFTKFIVLTGYDEPEFIRKSLDLKVFSYLLKPAGEEELLEAVKRQIAEIEKENLLRNKIKMIDYELERNREFFIESLLDDLLNGKIENEDELETRAGLLDISFKQPGYSCVLFTILDAQEIVRADGVQKLQNHFLAVEEIIKSVWIGEIWRVHIEHERLVMILGGVDIKQGLEWVLENIDRFLDVSVAAATGEPCDNIIHIWKSYRQALLAYESNSLPEFPGIISMNEMPDAPGLRFIYPAEKENELLASCIRSDSEQNISEAVKDLFDSMEQQNCAIERMRIEIMGFLALFSRKVADVGVELRNVFGCGLPELYTVMNKLDNRDELERWLREKLEQTSKMIRTNQSSLIGTKIAKANLYLLNNFCSCDMSLDVIAEHLQMNPSYFSRIFKKETGLNFVEALTAMRLEKARALLATTTIRIADVALSVGYQNSRYFWTLFKKLNGCSPSEYRESHYRN